MRRAAFAVLLLALVTAGLTAGPGSGGEQGTFKCPAAASEYSSEKWVKPYHGIPGSLWCDDGATATVTLRPGPSPPPFRGGVCTSASTGTAISIGIVITSRWKPTDPPSFSTSVWKSPSNPDGATFAWKDLKWSDEMNIHWSGLTGSWSGSDGHWIDNKFVDVKATATFSCKRIVKTGF